MSEKFEPFRVIVCGGRDFDDYDAGITALDRINMERGPIAMVVHGNARGADMIGSAWACRNRVREWVFPAEWAKYGKSAGPRRNKQMLGSGAKLVIAFPGGRGTRNMMKQAKAVGIEVLEVAPPPSGQGRE